MDSVSASSHLTKCLQMKQETGDKNLEWKFGYVEERVGWAKCVLSELFRGLPDETFDSMVDFGGGAGSWCLAAKQLGVSNVLLIDKCPPAQVIDIIASSSHLWCDLDKEIPEVARFDLAISIEVAEHLSEDQGKQLIKRLCETSDTILFSAAIPGQGGIGHINEQWHEYWHDIFISYGYNCFDILRSKLLTRPNIPWWIRQNVFVYQKKELSTSSSEFKVADGIELVHTDYLRALYSREPDLTSIIRALPSALNRSLARKFPRLFSIRPS